MFPQRKRNRLKYYDYSQNGAYFITICAKNRAQIFGRIVGTMIDRPPYTELSDIGKIIEKEILTVQKIRKNITIDRYVIMPNHVHMIIIIDNDDGNGNGNGNGNGRLTSAPTVPAPTIPAPTISEIIRLWKRAVSKQIGYSPWQKSFHDHIIRDEKSYQYIADYVENNPARWMDDCFYSADDDGQCTIAPATIPPSCRGGCQPPEQSNTMCRRGACQAPEQSIALCRRDGCQPPEQKTGD